MVQAPPVRLSVRNARETSTTRARFFRHVQHLEASSRAGIQGSSTRRSACPGQLPAMWQQCGLQLAGTRRRLPRRPPTPGARHAAWAARRSPLAPLLPRIAVSRGGGAHRLCFHGRRACVCTLSPHARACLAPCAADAACEFAPPRFAASCGTPVCNTTELTEQWDSCAVGGHINAASSCVQGTAPAPDTQRRLVFRGSPATVAGLVSKNGTISCTNGTNGTSLLVTVSSEWTGAGTPCSTTANATTNFTLAA